MTALDRAANATEFVCIFFHGDRLQLPLFARGVSTFLRSSAFGTLHLVSNDTVPLSEAERRSYAALFEGYVGKVSVTSQSDYLDRSRTPDWWTQQILKLKAAGLSTAENVVILDTKNVFCKPVDHGFFIAPDGRAWMGFNDFRRHPMADWLKASLRIFDLDHDLMQCFPQTVTPFAMQPAEIRALFAGLTERGLTLQDAFDVHRVSEFMLYSAHIRSRYGTFSGHMVERPYRSGYTIWPTGAAPEEVAAFLAGFASGPEAIFSIHREAMRHLSDRLTKIVTAFWVERGLFRDLEEAQRFVADFRADGRR